MIDKLISTMPEVVRSLAAPLEHVDKITSISTGGDSACMNKVTGDLTKNGCPGSRSVRNPFGGANGRPVQTSGRYDAQKRDKE